MARTALLSAAILIVSLGADGSQASLCGGQDPGRMDVAPEEGPTSDVAGDGGTPGDGGVRPDGGAMGGGSGKVPHLIHAPTGEDLGTLVDLLTLTVYSEKFDALIELGTYQPTKSVSIWFSEKDCNGKRYLEVQAPSVPRLSNKVFMIGATGTYLKPTGPVLRAPPLASFVRNSGGIIGNRLECFNSTGGMGDFTEYVDTGMKQRPPDEQLKVELR